MAAIPKLYDKTKETVELEQKLAQEQAILVWSAEAVRQIWNNSIADIVGSEALKNAYLQAEIQVDNSAKDKIFVRVSHPNHKEDISRNTAFLQIFRQKFGNPSIFFEFEIVAPVVEAKSVLANNPAMLSLEGKRLLAEKMLIDENPLVADFKAAFGLRFKNK